MISSTISFGERTRHCLGYDARTQDASASSFSPKSTLQISADNKKRSQKITVTRVTYGYESGFVKKKHEADLLFPGDQPRFTLAAQGPRSPCKPPPSWIGLVHCAAAGLRATPPGQGSACTCRPWTASCTPRCTCTHLSLSARSGERRHGG